MTQSIIVDQFYGVLSNITTCNNLIFNDEQLSTKGRNHNRALHVSMKFLDNVLSRVLVDTDSPLNVMPKSTLTKLYCKATSMKPSVLVVKSFDGSRKGCYRRGIPTHANRFACLSDNLLGYGYNMTYNCLLGRPWIHVVGAITFTLHPKNEICG